MVLKPQPVPRAERVIFVAAATPDFRARMMERLREAGYLPREIEPQNLLRTEPLFDIKGFAFFMVEAGEDKELIHQLIRHLHGQWAEKGIVLVFSFWSPSYSEIDVWRMYEAESNPQFGVVKFQVNKIFTNGKLFDECLFMLSQVLTRVEETPERPASPP